MTVSELAQRDFFHDYEEALGVLESSLLYYKKTGRGEQYVSSLEQWVKDLKRWYEEGWYHKRAERLIALNRTTYEM